MDRISVWKKVNIHNLGKYQDFYNIGFSSLSGTCKRLILQAVIVKTNE